MATEPVNINTQINDLAEAVGTDVKNINEQITIDEDAYELFLSHLGVDGPDGGYYISPTDKKKLVEILKYLAGSDTTVVEMINELNWGE